MMKRNPDGESDDLYSSYSSSEAGSARQNVVNDLTGAFQGMEIGKQRGLDDGAGASGVAIGNPQDRAEPEVSTTSAIRESQDLAEPSSRQTADIMLTDEQQKALGASQGQTVEGEIHGRPGCPIAMPDSIPMEHTNRAIAAVDPEGGMALHAEEDESIPGERTSGSQQLRQEILDSSFDTSIRDQEETFQLEQEHGSESNTAGNVDELSTALWRSTSPSRGPENTNRRSVTFGSLPTNIEGSSYTSGRNVRDIVIPRWQPDAEVTFCPICRTQFSFFVRKHHCRYVSVFSLFNHTFEFRVQGLIFIGNVEGSSATLALPIVLRFHTSILSSLLQPYLRLHRTLNQFRVSSDIIRRLPHLLTEMEA
jgi:FYVE zinc finger